MSTGRFRVVFENLIGRSRPDGLTGRLDDDDSAGDMGPEDAVPVKKPPVIARLLPVFIILLLFVIALALFALAF